jgi:hypothetical protein
VEGALHRPWLPHRRSTEMTAGADGPLIFLAIGLGIAVFALVVARILRRINRRPLPGSDERAAGTHWYAGKRDDGGFDDGE